MPIETNQNENTTTQNLYDSVKAVLRGRFIAIQAYLKRQEKSQINNLTLLPGEISITSDMQMTPPLWQKVKRN